MSPITTTSPPGAAPPAWFRTAARDLTELQFNETFKALGCKTPADRECARQRIEKLADEYRAFVYNHELGPSIQSAHDYFSDLTSQIADLEDLIERAPQYLPIGGPTHGWFETTRDPELENLIGQLQAIAVQLPTVRANILIRAARWPVNPGRVTVKGNIEGTPADRLAEECCRLLADSQAGRPSQSPTGPLGKLVHAVHVLALGEKAGSGLNYAIRRAAKAFTKLPRPAGITAN